ncbi:myeloid-associated differentiation marker homolog [Clupea harengus]|uniref:Myeloid-associated differentiation marker homolog n=1 Tax=Clupea harengus TaxID=7950 RepID=A0A6P3VW68_CLUHA|nr:myeloid-associated differentiation marker homolog [Clupea harengus]
MPVILGEVSILTTPLSGVRICALVSGCLTFSLVASGNLLEKAHLTPFGTFGTFCMFTWCFFFTLSLLILAITYIQFHSLLPLSWKNLTVTVSALATLMVFTASLAFPCLVLGKDEAKEPRAVAATVFSSLTFLAYTTETYLTRREQEQRGYMASIPGLLKVLQVFGSSMALLLVKYQAVHGSPGGRVWGSGVIYGICLVASLGTVVVMVGDCAGRCPLPFGRVLAALSVLGVLLYMVAAVMSSTAALIPQSAKKPEENLIIIIILEMSFACTTLLAYTVDLAFSVKLLCDRN